MAESLQSILNGEDQAVETVPAETLPQAGRVRQAVGGGGSSVAIQVGDSFEAVYNGSTTVTGKFGDSQLHKFTLIAPAELTVVHKDKDSGVKSEERKMLPVGTVITSFLKGNGDYLMRSVPENADIEVRRDVDGVLPKGHKFAGTKVATFEVLL